MLALTEAERAQIQSLLDEGAYLLQLIESIEAVIASLLHVRTPDDEDLITDAVAVGWTVDQLLEALGAEEDECA